MKIGYFATCMHIVIKTTCMMDLFNTPPCGRNFDTCIHIPPSWPPRPGSLLMLPHFLFTCSIFFLLSFVLIITKISNQTAMRKSIHDMVDVQYLGTRHQMSMLHYGIFYIRITARAALRNSQTVLSFQHAASSNCSYNAVPSNQYAVLNH